jgi:hypothetical protein
MGAECSETGKLGEERVRQQKYIGGRLFFAIADCRFPTAFEIVALYET